MMKVINNTMQQMDDQVNAQKVNDLIQKYERKEWVIALCGHFSAGKSSLVNALCGESILPSSPIPTSANIVSIRYGDEKQAYVTKRHQHQPVPVELNQLEAYCKDGEEIETVEIIFPAEHLNLEGLVVVDTPGMDSTDDRHREQTLGALHLADVVFYVTDYNHVQSEFNLSFAKQMKQIDKPFYLIINQIDKHRDEEIAYDTFMERVTRSFADWGAYPDGILTLSLKEHEHRYNEWSRLLWLIRSLSSERDNLCEMGTKQALLQCIEEHGKWRLSTWESEHPQIVNLMETMSLSEAELKAEEYKQAIDDAIAKPDQMMQETKNEVNKLLDNANIIPALTRDKVLRYLESTKKGFKASWWHSKRKTEKEIEERANDLLTDINENVETQIMTHLIDILASNSNTDNELLSDVSFVVNRAHIDSLIQSGAVISSEYALVYSRSLSAFIKEQIRKKAWHHLDQTIAELRDDTLKETEHYKALHMETIRIIEAYERWNAFQNEWEETRADWIEKVGTIASVDLPDWKDAPKTKAGIAPPLICEERIEGSDITKQIADAVHPSVGLTESTEPTEPLEQTMEHTDSNVERLIPYMDEAILSIEPFPLLQEMKNRWQQRQQQWKNKRMTIALFGAFSAGKSSFINALLGEPLLPSSPHPTTASICRVLPPEPTYKHGQVCIKLKTKQQLEKELQEVFTWFNWPFHHLEQAIQDGIEWFKTSSVAAERGQNEYEFIQALSAGYEEMGAKLGQQLVVELGDLERYVAEEKTSVFVDSIDVYYESPLAKQGIVLIDTPGVNSLNARHTRVSFEFMKQADAIVYVTYYNHVFSDADRQFLLQLGQVREQFELDRMFFVVNAKDLASSADELDVVMEHVHEQLRDLDIHRPRLYAVSSIQALAGKKGDRHAWENSGVQSFESAFYSYLFGQFAAQMQQTFVKEIEQSIDALQSWYDSSMEDEEQRKRKIKEQQAFAERTISRLKETEQSAEDRAKLERETNDLIYYARQRIYFRWGETFNHAFNPSNLSGAKSESRLQLWMAWQRLNAMLKNDCTQELLQVSLHVEKSLGAWLRQEAETMLEEITENMPTFPLFNLDDPQFSSPPVKEDWHVTDIDERWLVKHFKNPQSFFEGNGKDKMKDEMEPNVMKMIADYMDQHIAIFVDHYEAEWRISANERNEVIAQSLRNHIQSLSAMENSQTLITHYDTSMQQLRHLRSTVEKINLQ